jgi:hypothetical protein
VSHAVLVRLRRLTEYGYHDSPNFRLIDSDLNLILILCYKGYISLLVVSSQAWKSGDTIQRPKLLISSSPHLRRSVVFGGIDYVLSQFLPYLLKGIMIPCIIRIHTEIYYSGILL